MIDLEHVAHLLYQRYFAEAAYFGAVSALRSPTAEAHMLAGVGCCGCAEPLAMAQRLLEGVPVPDEELGGTGGLRISPASQLPYEGFLHLLQALRLDPSIKAPTNLRNVFDSIADDLAYVSRRELEPGPHKRRRYTLREASLSAAVLLRRLTESDRELPGVASPSLQKAMEIIDEELGQSSVDATY